jgi:hypothetical protein
MMTHFFQPLANGLVSAAALSLIFAAPAWAQFENLPAEERGYELAARSDASDNGFGDSEVAVTMRLRNAAGQETSREMTFRTLERENTDVGDKSLVVFSTPRDVEGTALLSHAQILDPDDQWLFLPALGRVRRISSANKSGPFVGSEFAFEDFTSLELNKYEYNWIGEEEIDGLAVDVVERFPLYENSGYTRQISYVDRDVHQIRRVEFFDRRDDLLKTLELSDYREYDGGVWRAHLLTMVNHTTGKSTDLIYDDYQFGADLSDGDFNRAALDRIR